MHNLIIAFTLLLAYLIGSIPFGLLVVKMLSGKDIRTIASGRTGGTNAMRAAGLLAGFITAVLDILKAAATVWMAQLMVPPYEWVHALAPVLAVLGHNHSIFLIARGPDGRIHMRGGAGGAAALGGALGLWPLAAVIMLPLGGLVWYLSGYASLTTLSIGVLAIGIFTARAALSFGPWVDIFYGMAVEILMVLALLPNLKRLAEGTERRHGLPALLEKRRLARSQDEPHSR